MGSHVFARTGVARTIGALFCLCACFGALSIAASEATATTVTVNTTESNSSSGDGLCSLQEAVSYAEGTAAPDCSPVVPLTGTTTIELPAGKYSVSTRIDLFYPTNIVGSGSSSTDIDGGDSTTVLSDDENDNPVTLSNLEVSGGNSGDSVSGCTGSGSSLNCPNGEAGYDAGGIYNYGTLTLQNVLVSGNQAGKGTGPILYGTHFCAPCDGGNGASGGDGGGIYNQGTLTVTNSTISGNDAGSGGPGANGFGSNGYGGNGADGGSGGGIYNIGTLAITNSTIENNNAGSGGSGGNGGAGETSNADGGNAGSGAKGGDGAGLTTSGKTTIIGSTFSGNRAGAGAAPGAPGASGGGTGVAGSSGQAGDGGSGGAIILSLATAITAQLSDDTISGNLAGSTAAVTSVSHDGLGGGIAYGGPGPLTLTAATIAGNTAGAGGGGIYVIPSYLPTETGSVIANNAGGAGAYENCGGFGMTDGGHNLVYGDASCPGRNADPKLGPLASNGGATQTLALGTGSAAIDLVPSSSCALTTDQRGITRPQGAACDAGAYESAPPGISGASATLTGAQSAIVTGQVTPNLTDAKVTVEYGTDGSYGASTSTTDLGAGSSAAGFSVPLSGLQPSTTYHAKVVATNLDGSTSSSDLMFTTAAAVISTIPNANEPSGKASISTDTIRGDVLSIKLACAASGPSCTGRLKLTSRVTTKGSKIVGVVATKKPKKAKRKTRTEAVGNGSYSLAAGKATTFKLTLNPAGKQLLKARKRLPAIASLTGAIKLSRRVTFVYVKPKPRKRK